MKLSKTNQGGIIAIKSGLLKNISKQVSGFKSHDLNGEKMQFWFYNFQHDKIIKITKQVYENSQLVDVDSLNEMVELETEHKDFIVLYHIDKIAYVRKVGKEIAFITINFMEGTNSVDVEAVGNYNFISGSFYPDDDIPQKKELLRLLIYLFYGDITERYIPAKVKVRLSETKFLLNDSPFPVSYANTLWRQRINVSGFKVRGHFRMQAHGEGRSKRKLIWIDEFAKFGYSRKSTVELFNDKTDDKTD